MKFQPCRFKNLFIEMTVRAILNKLLEKNQQTAGQ